MKSRDESACCVSVCSATHTETHTCLRLSILTHELRVTSAAFQHLLCEKLQADTHKNSHIYTTTH